ncbi:NAD(P)/FAD-dependent oxidoreductase [Crocosphaera subtropica]|nr:FAD-dependent oxidoreductase [Crocosphaera subtropica]
MAHIVVIGGGIGGLPTAYELRHLLLSSHQITLVSNQPNFTFIPSLPWVALNLISLQRIQLDIKSLLQKRGINWLLGTVTQLEPEKKQILVENETITYDYLIVATGAELALDTIPGLGPEMGYTQSVCNPHHATQAGEAWSEFLADPGPLIVGAVPGASCFGPAYEFAMLANATLRQSQPWKQVPITFVTPEPYVGHLGIGSMANSQALVRELMAKHNINILENAAICHISPDTIYLSNGERLPFKYAMVLPPFRGPSFLREIPGLTDEQGFLPVLPTGQHPDYPSLYGIGVVVKINPPEVTSIPIGVPKTGQMTEAMGMAAAHNIACELGELSSHLMIPTLEALCLADFGETGVCFLAAPILPDAITGQRRKAIALQGQWVNWSKTAFEQFFLLKMRLGWSVPWFERLALQGLGLSLVKPLPNQT